MTGGALQPAARIVVADRIEAVKREVAAEVNREFFRRHPDWEQRYGAAGVQRGFEDACYHMDYLAAAIEAASVELFENYARWTGRVLESRGIAPGFVIENLDQIESALESRLSPEEFLSIPVYFRAAARALTQSGAPEKQETDELRDLFRTALLLGQRNAALNIAVEALSNGRSPLDVYVNLCSKTLWEIGEMWERNQISVADEHRATAIVQYVVARIYAQIPLDPRNRGNVIVTGVEGEMHQLGGNIVADLLEADGWNVCFLGTNLPHRTILEKIEQHRAFAVFISATVPSNLLSVRRLVSDVRARFGSKILIVLGGQAFSAAAGFFQQAGADAFAPTAEIGAAIIAERDPANPLTLERGPQE